MGAHGCFLFLSPRSVRTTVTGYVEVPLASPALISRPRVGLGSLLRDRSFILCLTVTHYEVVSGLGGLDHLPWMVHSLGPDPGLLLPPNSLCPVPCPSVSQVYHIGEMPLEESTRAVQREVGLWEEQVPANEGIWRILPRCWAQGRGLGTVEANTHRALVGTNQDPFSFQCVRDAICGLIIKKFPINSFHGAHCILKQGLEAYF